MNPLTRPRPKAIVINTSDQGGGAERIAWTVFQGLEAAGWDSWFLVGEKKSQHPRVIPLHESPFIDHRRYHQPFRQRMLDALKRSDQQRGHDDFHYPYSRRVLDITETPPDIVFVVNLHGGYFDLRALGPLSRRRPVFVHVADHWWFSGQCVYPKGCPRWQTGCGHCPQRDQRAHRPDGTGHNWKQKRSLHRKSRLHVAAPSQWMLDRCRSSILQDGMVDSRVITCGTDLEQFRPGPHWAARRSLGLPFDEDILLFVANGGRQNPNKDFATLDAACQILARASFERPTRLVVVGGQDQGERKIGPNATIVERPYADSRDQLREYYQACDVFVHSVVEEVFGIVLIEAMACGRPVVASHAGGIPEIVASGEQGLLVPPSDPRQLAVAVGRLLGNRALRDQMGQSARQRAVDQFGEQTMVARYLDWFHEKGQVPRPMPWAKAG